eukprot:3267582-Amphidinium_carterae.1
MDSLKMGPTSKVTELLPCHLGYTIALTWVMPMYMVGLNKGSGFAQFDLESGLLSVVKDGELEREVSLTEVDKV